MAAVTNPRETRGRILTVLYHTFQRDPLVMMTPSDIADASKLRMDQLAASCHYLHDRSYIELMMGYNPPLFAAARIAPEGIDLYEDRKRFELLFSDVPAVRADLTAQVIPLMTALAREAETSALEGLRRDWLLADVTRLRDLLRRPQETWDYEQIHDALQWLAGQSSAELPLPALELLKEVLSRPRK
jgi:hypothetical protein